MTSFPGSRKQKYKLESLLIRTITSQEGEVVMATESPDVYGFHLPKVASFFRGCNVISRHYSLLREKELYFLE